MKNALLLAGRELRAYARSPIGYVVAAVTLLGEGVYFYTGGPQAQGLGGTGLSADVLETFFQAVGGGTMVIAALLAMRLIAGERENGTLVLLNTAPVREWEVVLGKFIAGLAFLALLGLLAAYMPALIFVNGKVSLGHILVGYLGLLLLAAASLAIGLFASALSPNQIIAALVGGVILLVFFFMFWVAPKTEPPINGLLNGLSIFHVRYRTFMLGTLRPENVVFDVAVAYFFLLAATKTLEARRWR
jgi:ABC-2 type transport system permease protein